MARFYDHPVTGKLHFSSPAGGAGGGITSVFDAPATPADLAAYPLQHARYMNDKRAAAEKVEADAAAETETAKVVDEVKAAVADVDKVLAHQTVPHDGTTK